MAQNRDWKVSYVRITDEGLERHNDVMLSDILDEDKKDIKSLTFLPVATDGVIDITSYLKGFNILENLFLPSMLTTTIEAASKECTMLRNLLILQHGATGQKMDTNVVKINAHEEDGDNTAQIRTFVTTTKDSRQTYIVNSRHVLNKEVIIEEKVIERLTAKQVNDYISGENGIMSVIDSINQDIEDERCRIEISSEVLEGLLNIFVEKGVTFEEFTIDFSKLYDKIESYKSITKSVNQVTIKEEVETNIIESYQSVLLRHYEGVIKDFADLVVKYVKGATLESEELLIETLTPLVVGVIMDSPQFDEDYKEGDTLDNILSEIPSAVARNVKSTRERGLVRKYLTTVVTNLKTNKEHAFDIIEDRLEERVGLEELREMIAKKFGLDITRNQPLKLVNNIIDIVGTKNMGTLTKDDVVGLIDKVESEMGNGEIRSKEMLEIVTRVTSDYPTKEEIKVLLADFIAKNGFAAIKAPGK